MKESLKFVKYSGNGNDFIILDNPTHPLNEKLIKGMCDRHFGIGADGVLVLTPPRTQGLDGEMRIFNADGGEAEMCGNGLRCLATFVDKKNSGAKDVYRLKTMNSIYEVIRHEGAFAIEMAEIKDKSLYDLSEFRDFEKSFFINTGVPHLVFLGKEIKQIDIKKVAPFYRHHPKFPNGTNVSFVELLDGSQAAYVRTYERGVEDETHSCGTGLTAVGLALNHWLGWKNVITLKNLGGLQQVRVGDKVYYSGEVKFCFKGEYPL